MYERGQVVVSTAGRDKGRLLAVVRTDSPFIYVCDGRERPLDNPKRKNPRHIEVTDAGLSEDQMRSDSALRKALAILSADILMKRG